MLTYVQWNVLNVIKDSKKGLSGDDLKNKIIETTGNTRPALHLVSPRMEALSLLTVVDDIVKITAEGKKALKEQPECPPKPEPKQKKSAKEAPVYVPLYSEEEIGNAKKKKRGKMVVKNEKHYAAWLAENPITTKVKKEREKSNYNFQIPVGKWQEAGATTGVEMKPNVTNAIRDLWETDVTVNFLITRKAFVALCATYGITSGSASAQWSFMCGHYADTLNQERFKIASGTRGRGAAPELPPFVQENVEVKTKTKTKKGKK